MSFDSRIQLVYVSRQRIRALFNEGKYWTRARNGEFTLEYIYNKLAPARAGQPRGTKSQIAPISIPTETRLLWFTNT